MIFNSSMYENIQRTYEECDIHQSIIIVNQEELRVLYTELMDGLYPVSLLDEIDDFRSMNTRILLLSCDQVTKMQYLDIIVDLGNPNDFVINLSDGDIEKQLSKIINYTRDG